MSDALSGPVFLAQLLFHVARQAHERIRVDPQPEEITSSALTAIVFSASALEAFMNELELWLSYMLATDPAADSRLTTLASLQEIEGEKGSIRLKYMLAAAALGRPLSKGQQPYQDFSLLIDLRNALVHYNGATATQNVDGLPMAPLAA
jgi:hypothetical protein